MKRNYLMKILSGIIGLSLAVSAICMPVNASAGQIEIVEVEPKLYYSAPRSVDSQTLKNVIADGIRNFDEKIDIAKYNLNRNEDLQIVYDAYMAAVCENPEFFYVHTGYQISSDRITKTLIDLYPQYTMTKEEYLECKPEFETAANELLSGTQGLDDFQKVLLLHDRLAQHITYTTDTKNEFNSYGALVEGKAVCQGYTLAYSYLLKQCGINSVPVSSEIMEHMWNLVELDGRYYHVDVTWDDSITQINGNQYEITGKVLYRYFLRTDDEIRTVQTQHSGWQTDIVCNSNKYSNLFLRNEDGRSTESQTYCKGDYIYYIKNNSGSSDIIKRSASTGAEKTLYTVENGRWAINGNKYTVWPAYDSRMASNGYDIYFNECDSIKKISLFDEKVSDVCTPDIDSDECVVGLGIVNDSLKYDKMKLNAYVTQLIDAGVDITPIIPTDPTTVQPTETTAEPTSSNVMYGDANGDDKVTASDVLIIRKHISGQKVSINTDVADVTLDGKITASDVLIIRKYISGQSVGPWS